MRGCRACSPVRRLRRTPRDIAAYLAGLRTAGGPPAETPGAVAARTNQVAERRQAFC